MSGRKVFILTQTESETCIGHVCCLGARYQVHGEEIHMGHFIQVPSSRQRVTSCRLPYIVEGPGRREDGASESYIYSKRKVRPSHGTMKDRAISKKKTGSF